MKKQLSFLFMTVCIMISGSPVHATAVRYDVTGGLCYWDGDISNLYYQISGSMIISDTDDAPDDILAQYQILCYDILIGDTHFTLNDQCGSIQFYPSDVYIWLGGGRFTSNYPGPGTLGGFDEFVLPSVFWGDNMPLYGCGTEPLAWIQAVGDIPGYEYSNGYVNLTENAAPVPEPVTLMLMGSGLFALAFMRKRPSK